MCGESRGKKCYKLLPNCPFDAGTLQFVSELRTARKLIHYPDPPDSDRHPWPKTTTLVELGHPKPRLPAPTHAAMFF